MKWREISNVLSIKSNWTEVLIYVHRSRLIIGFIVGTWFGMSITLVIMGLLKGA